MFMQKEGGNNKKNTYLAEYSTREILLCLVIPDVD
jgi:hypothetical protein